jgi:hypothetical protein
MFMRRSANIEFREARFANNSGFIHVRKSLPRLFIAGVALAGMIGCAQVKKPPAQLKAVTAGMGFDRVGRVNLFAGEPCAPQIMFSFQGQGSTAWLAAPKQETRILTEAAKNNRRVHVSGKWRRGAQANCSYVAVTSAEVTR